MKLVKIPAKTLYGIETRLSNFFAANQVDLWEEFAALQLECDIPERADDKMIAAYHSYEGDHTHSCTFFLGCEVIDVACVPEGFVLRHIPAGDYLLVSVAKDKDGVVQKAWKSILAVNMRRTYAIDFEVHGPEKVELHVGVH